jgi:hypothetical protein
MQYFLVFACKNISFKSALKFQNLNITREHKKSNIYIDLLFISKFFIKIASFF